MLIKERASTNSVSAEKGTDAMLKLLHARMVCHDGRVVDALTTYDGISESITLSYKKGSLGDEAIRRRWLPASTTSARLLPNAVKNGGSIGTCRSRS
jgi:hypothetical protein